MADTQVTQLITPLLPTSHGYFQEAAVVWWSDILVITDSLQEMNKLRGKAISYLASLSFLSYKHSEQTCCIVFIHAENLLLSASAL